MKRYLTNLLSAIRGVNPYQLELDKTKSACSDLSARTEVLAQRVQELLRSSVKIEESLHDYDRQLNDYRNLIEMLRGRIEEKNKALVQQKQAYRKKIEELQEELQQKK